MLGCGGLNLLNMAKEARHAMNISYKAQRRIVIVTFLTLPLVLLLLFTYYPALMLVYYSFTDWDGFGFKNIDYVGFDNYKDIFTNPEYFQILRNNAYYFIGGLVQTALALLFAVILNTKLRGRNLFRVVLFLPYILHSVAIAIMFQTVYHSTYGSLNLLLEKLGLESLKQLWLGNPAINDWSLAFVSMWMYLGYNMVIFLGSLQSISDDWYEAARIDGANAWQQFWHITMPSIKSVLNLMLILTLSGALQSFVVPYIMTLGANDTSTFLMKTLDVAFKFNQFGLASALAVVLLLMVAIVVGLQRVVLKED